MLYFDQNMKMIASIFGSFNKNNCKFYAHTDEYES